MTFSHRYLGVLHTGCEAVLFIHCNVTPVSGVTVRFAWKHCLRFEVAVFGDCEETVFFDQVSYVDTEIVPV